MNAAERADLVRRIEAQPRAIRRAGAGGPLDRAGAHGEGPGAAPRDAACVRRVGRRIVHRAAGRLDARLAEGTSVVSMQLGGGSKDTWVFEDPAAGRPARADDPSSAITSSARDPPDLPSRVADNLFWLGRYAERVEAGVRLVRALLPALSGEEDFGRAASLDTVVRLLAGLHYLPPEAPKSSLGEQRWRLQRLLTEMAYDPTPHVWPGMESEADAARGLASERAAVGRHLARAAAAGIRILRSPRRPTPTSALPPR